jgi:DNA-binding transcriptional regulator YhcF (GntR family)
LSIQFDEKIPIYLQIIDFIKKDIVTERLKGGEKLPSVREFAEQLKVNPNTVQRVYQEMEREGITSTIRGTGTFVKDDQKMIERIKWDMAKELMNSFVEGMKGIGLTPEQIKSYIIEFIDREEK